MSTPAKPSQPTVRTHELGHGLTLVRQRARLTGRQLSRRTGWDQSKISRVENGYRAASELDVAQYVTACGSDNKAEYQRLLAIAREPETGYLVRPHNLELPHELRTLILQEAEALSIVSYEPMLVPGLLQTEQYMRALFLWGTQRTEEEVEVRVRARLARQEVLRRQWPPECTFFIQERALRTLMGDAAVMNDQLLHLVFMAVQRDCVIRVVPECAGPFSAFGAFRVMHNSLDKPVGYTENLAVGTFLERPEDIERCERYLARLDDAALNRGQSRAWLADLASAYDQRRPAPHAHPEGPGAELAQEQLQQPERW